MNGSGVTDGLFVGRFHQCHVMHTMVRNGSSVRDMLRAVVVASMGTVHDLLMVSVVVAVSVGVDLVVGSGVGTVVRVMVDLVGLVVDRRVVTDMGQAVGDMVVGCGDFDMMVVQMGQMVQT